MYARDGRSPNTDRTSPVQTPGGLTETVGSITSTGRNSCFSRGTPVADLLVLSGESAPNNYPTDLQLLTAGYNYDFCCVDDLRELVQVKNGRITAPSGAQPMPSYRWVPTAT